MNRRNFFGAVGALMAGAVLGSNVKAMPTPGYLELTASGNSLFQWTSTHIFGDTQNHDRFVIDFPNDNVGIGTPGLSMSQIVGTITYAPVETGNDIVGEWHGAWL